MHNLIITGRGVFWHACRAILVAGLGLGPECRLSRIMYIFRVNSAFAVTLIKASALSLSPYTLNTVGEIERTWHMYIARARGPLELPHLLGLKGMPLALNLLAKP